MVSRIGQDLDERVQPVQGQPWDHGRFPRVTLDAAWLHGRFGRKWQPVSRVVSQAVVMAIAINALGYRGVLGKSPGRGCADAAGDREAQGCWRQFPGSSRSGAWTGPGW